MLLPQISFKRTEKLSFISLSFVDFVNFSTPGGLPWRKMTGMCLPEKDLYDPVLE